MSSVSTPKVRLVRCPNCRNVLPEIADVPVYMCGGCNTVLQAKNRKVDSENTSNLQETDSGQANESTPVVPESTLLPSSGECSSDQNDNSVDHKNSQFGAMDIQNENGDDDNNLLHNSPESCIDQFGRTSTELAYTENESSPLDGPDYKSDIDIDSTEPEDTQASGSPEQLIQRPQADHRGKKRLQSMDTFESNDFFSSRFEPIDTSYQTDESPHSYDRSDAWDDGPFPNTHYFRDSFKNSNLESTIEPVRNSSSAISSERVQPSRNSYPVRNWRPATARDGNRTRLPANNKFNLNPILNSPTGEEKSKLLRMVYELQHHLENTDFMNGGQNSYSGQLPPRPQHDRFQLDPSYPPPSGQFPRRQGFSEPYPGHNYANSYSSYSSSPHRYTDTLIPTWTSHDVGRYRREKHHVGKKYLPPTAGGAPFITCRRCFQLLPLPENFFAYKRKFRLIKCGSCSSILRLSLQDETHIVDETRNSSHKDPISPDLQRDKNMSIDDSNDVKGKGRMLGSSSMSKRTSALHSLMGYSTISQVFKKLEQPSGSSSSQSKESTRSKK